MDKNRELTPEARQVVDEITEKANLPPEEETPEPKPKTDRELTPEARQVVDEITEKANLPPEKETPKPPVTKEDVKKVITHLENIPTGDNASNQETA